MSEMLPVALPLDLEAAVRQRYGDAARAREGSLCWPVAYDARLLEAIPAEVIERDCGCGGPTGRVSGVDMNDDMLAFSRGAAPEVARRIGYANAEFRKGKIQDLLLDHDAVTTFGIYARKPYRAQLDPVQPYVQVPLGEAPPFRCNVGPLRRDPCETKGDDYQLTTEAGPICKPGDCC